MNAIEVNKEDILVLPDSRFCLNNVCIVTGVSSGIGRATAIAASVNNLHTVGIDMDEEGGLETVKLVKELGGQMTFVHADLTRDDEVEIAVSKASGIGEIKFLANIAGLQHIASVEEFSMEMYDHMQGIMLRAPFYLSKLVLPYIKRSVDGIGVIGNMASIHGHVSTANKSVYNIVKFGIRALSQSIAAEGEGLIRSFSVSTGFVDTPLVSKQIPIHAERLGITEQQVVSDIMLGGSRVKSMMTPIAVANLFIFGFSRFSNYLVGGDLLFDGGVVLTY